MSVHLAAIIGLLLIVVAATLRPVNAGAIALVGTFAVGTFVAGEDISDLGMLAVSAAVVLHLLFPSTSEGASSRIGWSTIVMVCGVVTYMALLQRTGAIKIMGDSVVSAPTLGVLLICFVAAITSVFAASPGVLGVVIPLSLPLLSTGAVSVTGVVIALGISATVVDASPFSAVGALVLANCPEPDREQMFRVLFWWGMAMALSAPLATWLFFVLIG